MAATGILGGVILVLTILAVVAVIALAAAAVSTRRARAADARRSSEMVRHQQQLDAEVQRRLALFDQLPVAALRVDSGGVVREINAQAREKFPHVPVGGGVLASFGEHRFADEIGAVLAGGDARTFELRLFADERRTFRISVEPIAGAAGDEALVYMLDFTDAVAYQELRSQFSANVSHELRTPLTGLAGLVEALGDPEIDPETHARFVARAASEIQRLVALITDVLFLSELEAPEWSLPEARSDARVAIANAVEALVDVASEHGVTITVEADAPVMTPLTERMATTVVQNLIENAVKYGGAGSATVVRARVTGDGAWSEIVCTDNGPGIPERHLPHVFERFYRADASRSKRLGGTGLGLSIVKHIAERYGGVAEASSREGFGTTVTVRMPMPPPDGAVVPVPGPEGASLVPTR
jgi:two-component system phosphate regulon sensor histidine kinase PhoR